MNIVTRFAPSPTGILHTGSARTALFAYLYARHNNGKFLLRIEDTDKERSKDEHTKAILEELQWLGIDWDGEVVYQATRIERHKEAAYQLLDMSKAYKCFASQQEIENFRQENPNKKFVSPWRDKDASSHPQAPYVVRLKSPMSGATIVSDMILGDIEFNNQELDDMVLLRSDGTPTYMLAVVVDDHDMAVTHIIRGDDHLTNGFRQTQIYRAFGWDIPKFAHIPLIHDTHGKKLSKRTGALGLDAYRDLGYLPEAVVNHLLRLGWSHGDDEIISMQNAIKWFDVSGIGKSPARFDIDKLNHINNYYIKNMDSEAIFASLLPYLPQGISDTIRDKIKLGIVGLKDRAQTLKDLSKSVEIYINKQSTLDDKAKDILAKLDFNMKSDIYKVMSHSTEWTQVSLQADFEALALKYSVKLPFFMQALRPLILGTSSSPGIFGVMEILGKDECLKRFPLDKTAPEPMRAHH